MMLGRALAALSLSLVLPVQAAPSAVPDTHALRLEKVVLVMRHGIRPATDTPALQAWSAKPWPAFGTADGQLTPHGRSAIVLLAQWQRHLLDDLGLFKPGTCPADQDAFIWSSPVPRAQATAAALAEGLFPDCKVAVHHSQPDQDPLFHASANGLGRLDPARSQAALVEAMGGSVEAVQQRYAAPLAQMQRLVGVPATCAKAPCGLSQQPWTLKHKGDTLKLSGPLSIAAAMSETLRMQYAEGIPLEQAGFGQVRNAAQVSQLMALRSGKYALSHHLPYVAQRGASQLLGQVLLALQAGTSAVPGGPPPVKWLAYVGHDSNIAELRTLLNFDWKIAEYPQNDAAPGGTLLFERWLDERSGERYVTLAYAAQSMDQLRQLASTPPYQVQFPGLPGDSHGPLMPLAAFETTMQARLDRTAMQPQDYGMGTPAR